VHADRGAERADGRLGEWDGHDGTERVADPRGSPDVDVEVVVASERDRIRVERDRLTGGDVPPDPTGTGDSGFR
jgi:hypothetical protein